MRQFIWTIAALQALLKSILACLAHHTAFQAFIHYITVEVPIQAFQTPTQHSEFILPYFTFNAIRTALIAYLHPLQLSTPWTTPATLYAAHTRHTHHITAASRSNHATLQALSASLTNLALTASQFAFHTSLILHHITTTTLQAYALPEVNTTATHAVSSAFHAHTTPITILIQGAVPLARRLHRGAFIPQLLFHPLRLAFTKRCWYSIYYN